MTDETSTSNGENQLSGDITRLLHLWGEQSEGALEALMPLILKKLHGLARASLHGESHSTLQPTALINEVYLELAGREKLAFVNRAQFFAFAGYLMRRVLVQRARARSAIKRGHEAMFVSTDEVGDQLRATTVNPCEILALEEALDHLARVDPRKARLVEMRFYAGLNLKEMAPLLQVTERTLKRDWQAARRWLALHLTSKTA